MRLFLLLALAMAISIIVFTVQNSAEITLTFINWTLSGPLALILAVPFVVGVIAGASLLIPIWWKKAKALKAQKKRLHELESAASTDSEPEETEVVEVAPEDGEKP